MVPDELDAKRVHAKRVQHRLSRRVRAHVTAFAPELATPSHYEAGAWSAGSSAALPYGWTDAALAALDGIARELDADPEDLLALLWSESGAQPRINAYGLAQITPIAQADMHWPPGAWAQIVAGPIEPQIAGVFAFWQHLQSAYGAGRTFAQIARSWGVSVGTVIYSFQGFPAAAMQATGPDSTLATPPESTYVNNAGLDLGNKGRITVGDIAQRIAKKKAELNAYPPGHHLAQRLALVSRSSPPSLAAIWQPFAAWFERTTGQPMTYSASGASSDASLLPLALIAIAGAAWLYSRTKRRAARR